MNISLKSGLKFKLRVMMAQVWYGTYKQDFVETTSIYEWPGLIILILAHNYWMHF